MEFQRSVIPHVDDLGASHGANEAFFQLAAAGMVTCGSVMVPGAWFREVVDRADAPHDIGVHLTLTSEWDSCRWSPISTTSRASGLIDGDGYFWRDVASVARNLVPEAAEAELRAQIERAIAAGLAPTHIDAHMAAAMLPGLLGLHVSLAREYGLWPVLPRSIRWAPDPAAYAASVAELDAAGLPVADHCRGTLPLDAADLERGWRDLLHGLPEGVTHLALHATTPGDFSAMSPAHASWREREYSLFAKGAVRAMCDEEGIAMVGCRDMQRLWVAHQRWAKAHPT